MYRGGSASNLLCKIHKIQSYFRSEEMTLQTHRARGGRAALSPAIAPAAWVWVCPWGFWRKIEPHFTFLLLLLSIDVYFPKTSAPWGLEICLFSANSQEQSGSSIHFYWKKTVMWYYCAHVDMCSLCFRVFCANVPKIGWEPYQEQTSHILLPLAPAPYFLVVPHFITANWLVNWLQGQDTKHYSEEFMNG